MNNFYVYIHVRQTDLNPFYVGKGKGNRAWWFNGRSNYWKRVKEKHGCIVQIYKDNLTENDAYQIEKELIAQIGIKNLCNHTAGGPGMPGWIASQSTRKKMSEKRKGRKHTEEARKKMSDARRGKPKSRQNVENQAKTTRGKKKTPEHCQALSLAMKNRKYNPEWGEKSGQSRMLPVFCVNNGKTYKSVRTAAKELNLDSGSISRVANGKYKSTKGYVFSYE